MIPIVSKLVSSYGMCRQKRCNSVTIPLQCFNPIRGSIDPTQRKQLTAICSDLVGLFSLQDEHGAVYDTVAGTFLMVGLGPECFASLSLGMSQKYTEQFKQPKLFASINGQIVSVPAEPENPLRTAEMTLEDDCVITGEIVNNGRRGEKPEKAQDEARRTMPEKNLHPGELGGC